MKKIRSIILSSIAIFSVSCGGSVSSSSSQETSFYTETIPGKTGKMLISDGYSDYKIVVPNGADQNILSAANELQLFLKESSSVTLDIITDEGLTLDSSSKYISLGRTALFSESGLKIAKELRETGYLIKRIGDSVFIAAKDSNGVCSGVYKMLSNTLDLEIYAVDEYKINKTNEVPLLDFNVEYTPTFDIRTYSMKSLNDRLYRQRMNMYCGLGKGHWITFAHTNVSQYLPLEKYYADHKDWYSHNDEMTNTPSANNVQVCYANEGMRQEMMKAMKEKIISNPDGKLLMIGHEDNTYMCPCSLCVEERRLYGGYGGQEMVFTNKIANDLDAWLADNYPDREIYYVFFAYQTSQEPPLKTEKYTTPEGDEVERYAKSADGKYIPIDGIKNIKFNQHVQVMYCPIDADFAKAFNENENETQYVQLSGWGDTFKSFGLNENIIIWNYSLNVRSYFVPMNCFGMTKTHYEFFNNLGGINVYDQGNYSSGIPCFEPLSVYAKCKLMNNRFLDYNELVYDFIDHYYDLAADDFADYFDFYRTYYKYLEREKGLNGSLWTVMDDSKELWPYEVVEHALSYLDKCLEDIEPLRATNPVRWETINNRLRRERLTPIYLLFQLYFNSLTKERQIEYYNDLVKYTSMYDIFETGESLGNLATLLDTWKNAIEG